jgi:hypothetical protein
MGERASCGPLLRPCPHAQETELETRTPRGARVGASGVESAVTSSQRSESRTHSERPRRRVAGGFRGPLSPLPPGPSRSSESVSLGGETDSETAETDSGDSGCLSHLKMRQILRLSPFPPWVFLGRWSLSHSVSLPSHETSLFVSSHPLLFRVRHETGVPMRQRKEAHPRTLKGGPLAVSYLRGRAVWPLAFETWGANDPPPWG